MIWFLVGCIPRPEAQLVDAVRWAEVASPDDPFDDRPDGSFCETGAWLPEDLNLELSLGVDTGDCNYLTVVQPLLADVIPGDELYMRLWHYELIAGRPAQAHAALWADGQVLWDVWVPIPSESGMVAPRWISQIYLEEGTPIMFHLHNHGANSWNLIEVSRNPDR